MNDQCKTCHRGEEKCLGHGKYCDGGNCLTKGFEEPLKPNDAPDDFKQKYVKEIIAKANRLKGRDDKRWKKIAKDDKQEKIAKWPFRCYYAALMLACEQAAENEWKDYYTGQTISWQYWRKGGKNVGAPAVDHIVSQGAPINIDGSTNFVFCTSEVNDAKNNLPVEDFEKLSIAFLTKQGYNIQKRHH